LAPPGAAVVRERGELGELIAQKQEAWCSGCLVLVSGLAMRGTTAERFFNKVE